MNAPPLECPICLKKDSIFFGTRRGFLIYKSTYCGLIFVWPIPQGESVYIEDYFCGAKNGFGYIDYDGDKSSQSVAIQRYLNAIDQYIPQKGRLLDVGAASGTFIAQAVSRGWDASGVEISEYAVKKGRANGLDIFQGTVANGEIKADSYDTITLFDVFEHVPSPERDLQHIHMALKENGLLAINTPDSSSVWARLWGKYWHLIIPPEHLFLFSRKALEILLVRNGFKILQFGTVGKSFSVPYIFRMLYLWTSFKMFQKVASFTERTFLSKLNIPINLRDNMFVIAKKI